ncbi:MULTISPECIES: MFS transporter [Nocardia]|uniref:MFS transporter n=1 Tax=Nocardia TaxID=1817 RepID=UPI0018942DC0|nr:MULTISPECIES: MFS transporter [Nocardia]MBF6350942.1 MFS transporter [Nocardia flavorosea]
MAVSAVLDADAPGARTVNLRIWSAAWPIAAVFVLANAATPLYVLWQAEFGFSKSTLTAVFCCYMAGMAVALLVSGVVSDRLGRKTVLVPALVLAITAALIFAAAPSTLALFAARTLTGVASGAMVSAGVAAVTDLAGPARLRSGALAGAVGIAAGTGLGPLLGGILSEVAPGPTVTVFLVETLFLLIALLLVAVLPMPRPPETQARGWVRLPRVPRPKRRHLLIGVMVAGPALSTTAFTLSLAPSLLSELLGTTNRIVAGAVACLTFTVATGVQFALRGLPVRRLLLLATASTVACVATLVFAVSHSSVPGLALAAALAGLAYGPGMLGGLSLLNGDIPADRLAEANAALNIGAYTVAGVAILGLGALSDAVGFALGVTLFALVVAAASVAGASLVLSGARSPR